MDQRDPIQARLHAACTNLHHNILPCAIPLELCPLRNLVKAHPAAYVVQRGDCCLCMSKLHVASVGPLVTKSR